MIGSLDADTVDAALARTDLPPDVRRALELRQLTASASVKKLFAMENMATRDDRLHNLIIHHKARTGRPGGADVQPLNLPRSGPKLIWCEACARPHRPDAICCPWCGALGRPGRDGRWTPETMVPHVLAIMALRSLDIVQQFFGDALLAISGCLRSLFQAADGFDLIASDYSSIEAVVIAMLAGEQWRIDTFRAQQDIYLVSVSRIRGVPVDFYVNYKAEHGEHHHERWTGKISELALGYGGWLGALRSMEKQYDVDLGMDDQAAKALIVAWRDASPAIVEFWGGQWRGPPWRRERAELFGCEGAFIRALQQPDMPIPLHGPHATIWFIYQTVRDQLIITLPSGRPLTYWTPRLGQSSRWPDELSISYWTENTNSKYGAVGWVCMDTYGGRIAENITQAVAYDVLRHAIINARAARYPCVLQVYDELVAEIPEAFGSVEQLEAIMMTLPPWAAGWPIRAAGGWRAKRYRKA